MLAGLQQDAIFGLTKNYGMPRSILVIGAGRSSTSLITYLLDHAAGGDWHVYVGDQDLSMAQEKVAGHTHGTAFEFRALDDQQRSERIASVDFVISMLPARFHHLVVADCITHRTHIITPSYVSQDLLDMKVDINQAGIAVINEMGLDPGLDHMSAMEAIDKIRNSGGEMTRFESFTGGLVAPESDNNPWGYKFTWNPRNVVLAGQGGAAQFVQAGKYKLIPYHELFSRVKPIEVGDHGMFEGYPNRDSLKYQEIYGLQGIPTLYRGTLRKNGFCEAWNVFVRLGMTDDTYKVPGLSHMTWRDFTNSFLVYSTEKTVETKLGGRYGYSQEIIEKLAWLGLFEDAPIGLTDRTPAQVLQYRLEQKLSLDPDDKDMIVMWHKFGYTLDGVKREKNSYMVVLGSDPQQTAMAKTVGYPVAIACRLMLEGRLNVKGLTLPVIPEVYQPVLKELGEMGITFTEKQIL